MKHKQRKRKHEKAKLHVANQAARKQAAIEDATALANSEKGFVRGMTSPPPPSGARRACLTLTFSPPMVCSPVPSAICLPHFQVGPGLVPRRTALGSAP